MEPLESAECRRAVGKKTSKRDKNFLPSHKIIKKVLIKNSSSFCVGRENKY